jgi:hypothetical protein
MDKGMEANREKPETSKKPNDVSDKKPKSKTRLFWEKYPEGIGSKILDMRAVLR